MKVGLAGGIIKDDKGKILLLHRNTKTLKQWELPGGKIEKKEAAINAAIRELNEELGIKVEVMNLFGSKAFVENGIEMIYYWYECRITENIPRLMEEKFDMVKYWGKSELYEIYDELSLNMKNLLPLL